MGQKGAAQNYSDVIAHVSPYLCSDKESGLFEAYQRPVTLALQTKMQHSGRN